MTRCTYDFLILFSAGQPGMDMAKMGAGGGGREVDGERDGHNLGGHNHNHPGVRQPEHSPTYQQQDMQDKHKKGKHTGTCFCLQ